MHNHVHTLTENEQRVGQLHLTALVTCQPIHNVQTQFIQCSRTNSLSGKQVFEERLGAKSELFSHGAIYSCKEGIAEHIISSQLVTQFYYLGST